VLVIPASYSSGGTDYATGTVSFICSDRINPIADYPKVGKIGKEGGLLVVF
jgi:hypothetical protein